MTHLQVVTVDLLNPCQLRRAEHLSRRMMCIQNAVARDPRALHLAEPEHWTAHESDSSGLASTAGIDRYLAEINSNDAICLTHLRQLAAEEEEAEESKTRKE